MLQLSSGYRKKSAWAACQKKKKVARTARGHMHARTQATPSYGHMLQCYTAQRFCFLSLFLSVLLLQDLSLEFKQYGILNKTEIRK